jgi:hypothetical protein
MYRALSGADSKSQKIPDIIINIDRNMTDKTFSMDLILISLFPIIKCSLPLILFNTDRKARANVVVFYSAACRAR